MEPEIKRQLFQMLCGSLAAALTILLGRCTALLGMMAIAVVGVVIQVLVIKGMKIPVVRTFLKHMEREGSLPGKGAMAMVAGVLLALLIFPESAVQAMLILGISDSLSTLVGMRFRKKFFGKKSKEGSFAFIASAFLISLVFQQPLKALMVAAAAAAAEILPVEDNLAVPLAVGIASKVL